MKVRSIHPHVWHSTGKLVFHPVGSGHFEAELPDEVAEELTKNLPYDFQTLEPDQFELDHKAAVEVWLGNQTDAETAKTLHGDGPRQDDMEEELVDDPADEHVSEKPPPSARRGRRGGSRTV